MANTATNTAKSPFPPGPANFAARLAHARANAKPEHGGAFLVRLPENHRVDDSDRPVFLWSLPASFKSADGEPLEPIAFTLCLPDVPNEIAPLFYMVLQGRETQEYAKMLSILATEGLRFDKTVYSIFDGLMDVICQVALRRGPCVPRPQADEPQASKSTKDEGAQNG